MKKTILLSLLIGFLSVHPSFAKPVKKGKVTKAASNISSLGGKLVHAQEIMKGFEQGKEKVKVIVNLAEPPKIRAKVRWKSKASLQGFQDKIKATQLPVLSALSKSEFKLRHQFENQAGFSGEVTLKALEKLIDDPCVVSIEPVFLVEPHLNQGIPLMDADIYRSTYNGQGIAIAICDTGIDYTHPMLGGGSFPNTKVIGGYDFGDDDSDPMPHNSQAHGTACAGIAAGDLSTVGDYIGGVAYNARLYALKITSGADSTAGNDDIIAAWDWCITHRNDDPSHPIMVISTSFGGGRHFSECSNQTANNAVAAGITVLASAGNDGYCNSISWPACISDVISVGAVYDADFGTYQPCVSSQSCATTYSSSGCPTGYYAIDSTAADMVTSYSNTAIFLDILAPSNRAYTTDIVGSGGESSGDYDTSFGGTSAACPYAAGAVACLQEAAEDIIGTYLSPDQVRNTLIDTGNNVTDGKVAITKPRLSLSSAIESLESGDDTDPVLSSPQVSPSSGVEWETNFKYSVHYYDADGDIPIANGATVYIDGQGYDMSLESGDPANGDYSYTTQLDVGTHHYAFAFVNNNGFDMTPTYINPFVHTEGCGVELKVEVSGGPVTNNIEIEFEYGPDLFDMVSQQWYAPELPQELWIDPGQQLMFSVSVESNNHTFIKWEFRDDEGNLVRESTASGYGFILNSGNIHATAYLSYTPINYTISGTIQRDDGSAIPGGVDLTLTSPQQTLNQHIVSDNFSFTGVNGGVPVSITYEASDGGYAFTPSSLSWGNLESDHTNESVTGYSSDTSVPITSFSMVRPGVSEDSTISFSWIGEDDVTAPENLLYQYKLDGVDADWSLWTLGTFRLYDVENGEYTFWVRAKDEAGNINQAPSNYKFVVNAAPKITSANRINRSVWASRLTLEMPVGASNPTNNFVLLLEHSDMSDSELVPVTMHRIDEVTPCGASEYVASELGVTESITKTSKGYLVSLPDSIAAGQVAQYDIVWGKIKYFGWQESVSIPAGFPNGGQISGSYLNNDLNLWRWARKNVPHTSCAADDDNWAYLNAANMNGPFINERILRFTKGQIATDCIGTCTAYYHGRIFDIGTNKCAIWKDEKYEYDGSTDNHDQRYGLQLFDSTGATVGSVDGDYYNRISWSLPKQAVHNKIWLNGYEWGSKNGTPSAFYIVLNSSGGIDISKTNFDTITGKIYGDLDATPPTEVGSNVIFAWSRGWETPDPDNYYRRELVYQVRNTSGSIVKSSTVFSGALYLDSVEEDDEYDIHGFLLTDKEGKVWITYERDRSDQPREYYYIIIGTDGNVWKGPIQTTNERSFNYCDKDGYIWAYENGQILILNPDDTPAEPPRTGGWTPNQDVGLIATSAGASDYRLYDRWTPQTVGIDIPSGGKPTSMNLFDLNMWDNNLHATDVNLTKGVTTVWSHAGQLTNQATVNVSGILDEGQNILAISQDDFLGGQILITFPYSIPLRGDISGDNIVNFEDFAKLALRWLDTNCGIGNNWCEGADFEPDGNVDSNDLFVLASNWLEEKHVNFYSFPLNTNPGWTVEGEWAFGQPSGGGGTQGYPDPNSGNTGLNIYGVNLDGDYTANVVGGPYYLTAGPFDCSEYHNIKLEFARWLNSDLPSFVASKIEVSDNGTDWSVVWEHTGSSDIADNNWLAMEYDISSTADNQSTVYVRWSYEILDDRAYEYSGWNIDDIQLWGNRR